GGARSGSLPPGRVAQPHGERLVRVLERFARGCSGSPLARRASEGRPREGGLAGASGSRLLQAPALRSTGLPPGHLERTHMDTLATKKRILILGGGFGGVFTARHLERFFKGRADVEIVLVSRDNFLVMTPLLFEAFSGTLDVRHCSFPIRAFLRTT